MLIKDTVGNVLGGYTSMEWDSPATHIGIWCHDPSAFLFTVMNQRADPPALFASRTNTSSVGSFYWCGPVFNGLAINMRATGGFSNFCVSDFGYAYHANNDRVATEVEYYTPDEVEVWVAGMY